MTDFDKLDVLDRELIKRAFTIYDSIHPSSIFRMGWIMSRDIHERLMVMRTDMILTTANGLVVMLIGLPIHVIVPTHVDGNREKTDYLCLGIRR